MLKKTALAARALEALRVAPHRSVSAWHTSKSPSPLRCARSPHSSYLRGPVCAQGSTPSHGAAWPNPKLLPRVFCASEARDVQTIRVPVVGAQAQAAWPETHGAEWRRCRSIETAIRSCGQPGSEIRLPQACLTHARTRALSCACAVCCAWWPGGRSAGDARECGFAPVASATALFREPRRQARAVDGLAQLRGCVIEVQAAVDVAGERVRKHCHPPPQTQGDRGLPLGRPTARASARPAAREGARPGAPTRTCARARGPVLGSEAPRAGRGARRSVGGQLLLSKVGGETIRCFPR